jgi:hypothetical protein
VARVEARLLLEWNRIDSDGSGALDRAEMRALFDTMGRPMARRKFDVVFNQMDDDGSGELEYPEFLDWWRTEEELKKQRHSEIERRNKDALAQSQIGGALAATLGAGGRSAKASGRGSSKAASQRALDRLQVGRSPVTVTYHALGGLADALGGWPAAAPGPRRLREPNRPGPPGTLTLPQRAPQSIGFLWRVCMSAQLGA